MTIATGVQAMAECAYGRVDEALWYINRIVDTFGRTLPGSINELMPDYGLSLIHILTTSGVAGDAPAIRIRGVGTLNNNSPLYVIDGFPTKSEIASQINPSSIESVQVLKDASSASIYGSQAANGVISVSYTHLLKYQSKLQIAATIENNPKELNKDTIKYSEGSIDLLNLYSCLLYTSRCV